jgi:parallel beta-helix repeat protein
MEPHANLAAVTIDKPLKLMGKPDKSDPVTARQDRAGPGPDPRYSRRGHRDHAHRWPADQEDDGAGFTNNGIWLRYVDNFRIDSNTTIDNGENGIWPTLSANGQVKKNTSYGSDDSALWVEASTNVRVLRTRSTTR